MIKKLLKKIQIYFNLVKPQKIIDALFKSYVVLIIVPVFVLGCIFTSMYSAKILEYSKNKSVLVMENTIDIMNEKIDFVNNVTYNLATNKDFLNFNKYEVVSAERSVALFNMRTTLEFFLEQSDIMDDIFVYYKEGSVVLGRDTDYKTSRKLDLIFGMDKKEFEEFLDNQNSNFVKIQGKDDAGNEKDYLLYIKSIDNWLRPGEIYAVYLLDDSSIRDILNIVNVDNAGNVFLFNNDRKCLLQGDNEKIEHNLLENKFEKTDGDNYGYHSVRYGGKKYLVLEGGIGTSGLEMYFAVEDGFYLKQIHYIWIAIFLVCAFIVVVGMSIAKIYAMRIYRPIMNISEMFRPDKNKESPGQKFLESKFVEIQQIQEKFSTYNELYRNFIKERQIGYFLKKYITDSGDFKQQLRELNINTENRYYTILLMKIDMLREISENIESQYYRDFIKENFILELKNHFNGKYNDILGFYDDEYIGILICHDSECCFYDGLKFVQSQIYYKLDMTVSLYYTEQLEAWEALPGAYEILRNIVKQVKLCKSGMLINSNKWKADRKYVDFGVYSDRLVSLVKTKDYDELDKLIDDLFIDSKLLFDETVYVFSSFLIILSGIINDNSMGEEFSVTNPYKSIDDFTSTAEIAEYLKLLCRKVGNNIVSGVQLKDTMREKMLQYIQENYMKQITQREAAETFGFSVGYFSRYFKSVVGKSFIEALNYYRIEKAKEMITNDRTARFIDISEKCGFVSYKTFSDAFKRYEGKSPEKFKHSLL